MACHQMTYSMWHSPHVQDGHSNWRRRVWSAALLLQLRCISPSLFCSLARSFIRVTWLFHMCDMTHLPESLMRDLRLVLCGIIHSHVWHVSFPCVTWLIPMCDMTLSYVWHDSFIYVKWLIHMCDVLHSYVWHHSAHAARAQKYLYSYTRVSVYTHTYIEHSLQRNRCRFRTTLPLEDPTPPHLPKIASSPQAMVCTRVNRGTPNLHDFLAPFSCLFYRPISFNPLHNSMYILYITHT